MIPARVSYRPRRLLAEWWWTIDKVNFLLVLILVLFGIMLVAAAGSATAERIDMVGKLIPPEWIFFTKHCMFVFIGIAVMCGLSFMPEYIMRRTAMGIFLISWLCLVATLVIGTEIKGSHRWLSIMGLSFQPSEFVKPSFVIFCAWLFSRDMQGGYALPGRLISFGALLAVISVLVLQPDLGQTMLISAVWSIMFFVTGAHMAWFLGIAGLVVVGSIGAYFTFSHVHDRINHFLFADERDIYGEGYQMQKAHDAIVSGGIWGKGPGEGQIKQSLPDVHTDFIFSVAAEEYGLIVCMMIICIFAYLMIRALLNAQKQTDYFRMIAITGLITQFTLQAFINISVNLGVLPPKGMTLPFISYGGSSSVALGMGMGFLLCLTKRKVGEEK